MRWGGFLSCLYFILPFIFYLFLAGGFSATVWTVFFLESRSHRGVSEPRLRSVCPWLPCRRRLSGRVGQQAPLGGGEVWGFSCWLARGRAAGLSGRDLG